MSSFTLPAIGEHAGRAELRAYLISLTEQVCRKLTELEDDSEAGAEQARVMREALARSESELNGHSGRLAALGASRPKEGNEPPADPVTGTLWLDTSGEYPAYRRFDGENWVPVTDYSLLAGNARRVTDIENIVSESGIARMVTESSEVGGAVKRVVNTALIQGADGIEARLTRVEQGIAPVTDWIRWETYEGETGLMIGTDRSAVWVFITNSALRIMNGSGTAAVFALNRAEMKDAFVESGITLGNMRLDHTGENGIVIRPQ